MKTCKCHFNNEAWHNSFFIGQLKYGTNFQMNQFLAKKLKYFGKLKKFDLNKIFVSKIKE